MVANQAGHQSATGARCILEWRGGGLGCLEPGLPRRHLLAQRGLASYMLLTRSAAPQLLRNGPWRPWAGPKHQHRSKGAKKKVVLQLWAAAEKQLQNHVVVHSCGGEEEAGLVVACEVGGGGATKALLLQQVVTCAAAASSDDDDDGPTQDEEEVVIGLCKEGKLDKALDVVVSMDQQRGAVPSVQTFRCLLKTCGERKAVGQARRVHALLVKHGLEFTSTLGEYLVITLVKCNGLGDALRVFDRLPARTVFSWTAVISGYVSAGQVQTALVMYDRMLRHDGVHPNRFTIVHVLKGCAGTANLRDGTRVHRDAVRYGCDSDLYVATGLVHMYAKCGDVAAAQRIFDGLPSRRRDAVLWNAMLAGYVSQGQAEKVLQAYERMHKESEEGEESGTVPEPDGWTFVSALQACGILADEEEDGVVGGSRRVLKVEALQKAKAIHFVACRRGYGADEFVGNTLVSVYSKCGSVADAKKAFGALARRTVVAWTAMMALCTQQGLVTASLELYREMQEEGVSPNDRTFVTLLQACGMLADAEEDVRFVSVDGGGGGGQLCVVVKLPALGMGKAVHAALWAKGYDSDAFVANTLISMYGKCGSVADAQTVFDNMGPSSRDVVSWTAMLMALNEQQQTAARNGQAQETTALVRYEEMREAGVSPNDRTYVSVLQTCGMLGETEEAVVNGLKAEALSKGKAVHADARMKGYAADVFVGNTLISFYGKCGSVADAECVFQHLSSSERDVVSWNAMIVASLGGGSGGAEQCLLLYRRMRDQGVAPNDRTLVVLLQACGLLADKEEDVLLVEGGGPGGGPGGGCWVKPKALELGKAVHADACRMGYGSDAFIANTLVSVYGKCGSIVDAAAVFQGLPKKTVVSWNAMIAAHVEQGDGDRALALYREMMLTTAQSSGGGGGGGADADAPAPAAAAAATMCNDVTVVCVLQACCNKGSLDICRHVHRHYITCSSTPTSGGTGTPAAAAAAAALSSTNLQVANTLIHAYGRAASMGEAQAVFDALPRPTTVSWTALMAGYARQGDHAAVQRCYDRMQAAGTRPNGVTFLCLLSACTHAGLVHQGVRHFECMTRDHGIAPGVEHYGSLVDLLARSGHFAAVEALLCAMSVPPDLSVWVCVLGACRKHAGTAPVVVGLARRAFERAVAAQPAHASAYVLMAGVYSQAGMWELAGEVNGMRHRAGAWKKAGQSWTGGGGGGPGVAAQEVHCFGVGDRDHPQSGAIHGLLSSLAAARPGVEMEKDGQDSRICGRRASDLWAPNTTGVSDIHVQQSRSSA